jgi:hypothetical protein
MAGLDGWPPLRHRQRQTRDRTRRIGRLIHFQPFDLRLCSRGRPRSADSPQQASIIVAWETVSRGPPARRSDSHRPGGQRCRRDDGLLRVGAGDTVWAPSGVRHWHAAAPDRYMMHTAVWLADDHFGPVDDASRGDPDRSDGRSHWGLGSHPAAGRGRHATARPGCRGSADTSEL